jgi:23S rRNA (guanosine2251-2'-O)-methyltransferase
MIEKKKKEQLVIGIHPILEAVRAGKEINKVFIKKGLQSDQASELLQLLRKHQVPIQLVPVEKLNRMSQANHQGVIASLSSVDYFNLAEIVRQCFENGRDPFILVLDHLTDVRNFGAIARTAECAGVDAIVIPSKGSVSITADAIKSSAGALNRIPVCREENLQLTVRYLHDSGLMTIVANEKAENPYYAEELTGPIALIMGSEEEGVSASIIRMADKLIKIPMAGTVESLNVSVACGILSFEVLKQRMAIVHN